MLTRFSNQLADGQFDSVFNWHQLDEIGQLATQLDKMRCDLKVLFTEQNAILENVPAGVVFIRNDLIELANRHAEKIFGYAQGTMTKLPMQSLFLSRQSIYCYP